MYEIKADLSGNIWLVARESAMVKQQPDLERIEAANIHSMMDVRVLERTILVEEEATGFGQDNQRGPSGGGKASTTV